MQNFEYKFFSGFEKRFGINSVVTVGEKALQILRHGQNPIPEEIASEAKKLEHYFELSKN